MRTAKMNALRLIAVLALVTMTFTACAKSEFGVTENTGKKMTITAENADKDAFFMVDSLDVEEGEQIVITSELTKGLISVEIIPNSEEQSIDKLPEIGGDPVVTANLGTEDGSKTETVSGTVPAGNYMVQATCLEKSTGTVRIEVK